MGAIDFGRRAFNVAEHYSSVSMQQGHVQLDADSGEASEANSEKIRRLTADTATPDAHTALRDAVAPLTPADPAPLDSTTSTMPSAPAGFEPTGGLHPLANKPGVALFAGILRHLHETPRDSGQPELFADDGGAGAPSKGLRKASAD